jgi:hypothetical protein
MENLETDQPTALKAYDIYYRIGENSACVRGAFTSDIKACVFAHALQPPGSHFEVWKDDERIYARPAQQGRVAAGHAAQPVGAPVRLAHPG